MVEKEKIGVSVSENAHQHFHELTPCPDWTGVASHEHVVQFYETDNFLLDMLSNFIATALRDGDSCIVVASKAHRDGADERLIRSGIDVDAFKSCGQYVALDASETLAKIIVDRVPDPARFDEVIGSVVAKSKECGRHVRIFGEMVALLWDEDNSKAALKLEACWNELQKKHSFSLRCAYPVSSFDKVEPSGGLADVCAAHSHTIPAESYSALTSTDERLRNITQLQQKARLLEAEIVERKRIAEELKISLDQERIARAEAEAADRLKDEFLATVSHELRTPLNAIIGWSYMIRSRELDEAMYEHAIETIERNAKSQAQLIEDILDVSRVITGKLRLDIEPVDVVTVINAAIDSVQLAAESKGIQLEVTLASSSRHVVGDSMRLQQVVWNLLSNAIKFTPSGGQVTVKLDRSGPVAQITVSDTGEGIDKNFLPYIFDRFRQADGASTRRHGGLGLGLAIVRHLVELHGGTVQARSNGNGTGSIFTIKIPLAPCSEPAATSSRVTGQLRPVKDWDSRDTPQLSSLDGVRVLVVDNDLDTVTVLAALLTNCGGKVQTATSVAEALKELERFKPHVLVSDLAMPDEDGYALIGKIRALPAEGRRDIPAVALTAFVRVDDRARALSAGFNMFVPKPVVPDELISAIVTLAELESKQMILPQSVAH